MTAGGAGGCACGDSATFCGYGSQSFRGEPGGETPGRGTAPEGTGRISGMTSTATAPGPAAPAPGPPPSPPDGRDRAGGRSGLLGLLDLPGQGVRAIVRSAATTPGRLTVIAVGLVLLSLIAGLVATLSVQNRDDTISGVI